MGFVIVGFVVVMLLAGYSRGKSKESKPESKPAATFNANQIMGSLTNFSDWCTSTYLPSLSGPAVTGTPTTNPGGLPIVPGAGPPPGG